MGVLKDRGARGDEDARQEYDRLDRENKLNTTLSEEINGLSHLLPTMATVGDCKAAVNKAEVLVMISRNLSGELNEDGEKSFFEAYKLLLNIKKELNSKENNGAVATAQKKSVQVCCAVILQMLAKLKSGMKKNNREISAMR